MNFSFGLGSGSNGFKFYVEGLLKCVWIVDYWSSKGLSLVDFINDLSENGVKITDVECDDCYVILRYEGCLFSVLDLLKMHHLSLSVTDDGIWIPALWLVHELEKCRQLEREWEKWVEDEKYKCLIEQYKSMEEEWIEDLLDDLDEPSTQPIVFIENDGVNHSLFEYS